MTLIPQLTFIWEISIGNLMVLGGVVGAFWFAYRVFGQRLVHLEKTVDKIENVIAHRDFQAVVEAALRKKHGDQ